MICLGFTRICREIVDVAIYALYPERFCGRNLAIRKVFAFSDSGLDIGFFEQILRNERFMKKKSFFCIFSLPPPKKIQVAANRTILKIDAFHIAHFEAYVPLFPKHLWNLTIPQKLWVSALFEVG